MLYIVMPQHIPRSITQRVQVHPLFSAVNHRSGRFEISTVIGNSLTATLYYLQTQNEQSMGGSDIVYTTESSYAAVDTMDRAAVVHAAGRFSPFSAVNHKS